MAWLVLSISSESLGFRRTILMLRGDCDATDRGDADLAISSPFIFFYSINPDVLLISFVSLVWSVFECMVGTINTTTIHQKFLCKLEHFGPSSSVFGPLVTVPVSLHGLEGLPCNPGESIQPNDRKTRNGRWR